MSRIRSTHIGMLLSLALGLGLIVTLLWLLGGALPVVRAAAITVDLIVDESDGSCSDGDCSLRDALATVGDGDTIDFDLPAYPATIVLSGTELVVGQNITIAGPGVDQLFISGNGTSRVFNITGQAVVLQSLTVMDGNAAVGGGGIYYNHITGTLLLRDVSLSKNVAGSAGGGLYVYQGRAVVSGTEIVSNTAGSGGGVYVLRGEAVLSGGSIHSNAASFGGGLYVREGSVTLNGSDVVSNAADFGGGLYVYHHTAVFTQTGGTISGSTGGSYGGGVYVRDGQAMLDGGEIVSNAADFGGGLYVWTGSVMLRGGAIVSNTAGYGGGVYVYQNTATFTQTGGTVGLNVASTSGGGVYVQQGDIQLRGGEIVSNSAEYGGGVYVYNGRAVLDGGRICANLAGEIGGGLAVMLGQATMDSGEIVFNTSDYGGGVYVNQDTAVFVLAGGTIGYNSAAIDGGGLLVNLGDAIVNGGRIVSNAAGSGGGMAVWSGSAVLNGGQIVSNTAGYGGGVVLSRNSAVLTEIGGEIAYNVAITDGGGLVVGLGDAFLNGGVIRANAAGGAGGGVAVQSGRAMLQSVSVADNTAPNGSALFLDRYGAEVTPTLPITLSGDVYLADGTFYGRVHDLRVDGALVVEGGLFYAPPVFDLTGAFTHTGGRYEQTRIVSGRTDVAFPKAGGVVINANGQDLGSTQVLLQAGQPCARPRSPRVAHCYTITPANGSGRDAAVTLYYNGAELGSGACLGTYAFWWDETMWQGPLALDTAHGSGGRACGSAPYSLRVTGVSEFSLFGILAVNLLYLPAVLR